VTQVRADEGIDYEEARKIAEEIRDERGTNRVMELQRARMWDHDPGEWTRYERALSAFVLALLSERDAREKLLDEIIEAWHQSHHPPAAPGQPCEFGYCTLDVGLPATEPAQPEEEQ
jgi:hypothetical protein